MLSIVIVGAALLSLFFLYQNYRLGLSDGQSTKAIAQEKARSGLPVRLTIPKINVDATVEYVDTAPDGTMGVTKGPNDVAWYEPGKIPGENGSAVIAGHSGWKDGIPAVFDNLFKLKKGDRVYVENDEEIVSTFVVREVRIYDPQADATGVFNSEDGTAHLNLITCAGIWDTLSKSSSERLVVFTDEEN